VARGPARSLVLGYAAIAAMLGGSLWLLFGTRDILPRGLRPLVEAAAARHGLDAGLVEAVVRAESRGDPEAVSRRGACGLMQLTLPTAADVAGRTVTMAELFDPATNLDLGCRYLKMLLNRYPSDLRLALMAYNAGLGTVDRWLREEPDPDGILARLAYRETRGYVEKVLGYLRG